MTQFSTRRDYSNFTWLKRQLRLKERNSIADGELKTGWLLAMNLMTPHAISALAALHKPTIANTLLFNVCARCYWHTGLQSSWKLNLQKSAISFTLRHPLVTCCEGVNRRHFQTLKKRRHFFHSEIRTLLSVTIPAYLFETVNTCFNLKILTYKISTLKAFPLRKTKLH